VRTLSTRAPERASVGSLMTMRRFVVLAVAMLLPSVALASTEPEPVDDSQSGRTTGEHLQIPSRLVRDPFVTTFFGLATAAGFGEVKGPSFSLQGVQILGRRSYHIGFLGEQFDAGVRLLPWLSIRLSGVGAALTGTDGASALVVGATAFSSGSAGLTLATQIGGNLRLAFVGDVLYRPQFDVTVVGGLAASIASGSIDPSGIFSRADLTVYTAGVSAAYGVGKALGLIANVNYQHQRSDRQGVVNNANDLGGSAQFDVNFGAISPVPLAIVGSYRVDTAFALGSFNTTQEVAAGLYYTGRTALVLGLDVGARFFDLRTSALDTRAGIGTFVLRYYFN
jgi:hypothetical protein